MLPYLTQHFPLTFEKVHSYVSLNNLDLLSDGIFPFTYYNN